ncbi:hypothetical protein [Bradyrhizobium zhanjiangense]|uniref:hypothetical protein n=1 Tax=Bradyrhizobium zhanjiangense TaxID=1325107 RepID=UPI0013E8B211|nr:hypothetical protein [Bradyrhizobium zhanjiangense]
MTEEAIAISEADPADCHLIVATAARRAAPAVCLSREPEERYDFAEFFKSRFSAL